MFRFLHSRRFHCISHMTFVSFAVVVPFKSSSLLDWKIKNASMQFYLRMIVITISINEIIDNRGFVTLTSLHCFKKTVFQSYLHISFIFYNINVKFIFNSLKLKRNQSFLILTLQPNFSSTSSIVTSFTVSS